MQGTSRSDRDLGTWRRDRSLVQPGNVFAFLAAHRMELFPDEFIADLSTSPTGRLAAGGLVGSALVSRSCMTCPTRRPRTR